MLPRPASVVKLLLVHHVLHEELAQITRPGPWIIPDEPVLSGRVQV